MFLRAVLNRAPGAVGGCCLRGCSVMIVFCWVTRLTGLVRRLRQSGAWHREDSPRRVDRPDSYPYSFDAAGVALCYMVPPPQTLPMCCYSISPIPLQLIREQRPEFVGLHCQEVGGKNYETSMKHVSKFVR